MKTATCLERLLLTSFRAALFCVVTFCGYCPSASAASVSQPGSAYALASQEFFCSAGFDRDQCLQDVANLKAVLIHYPAGMPSNWSWIIVRSEDWQPLLRRLRQDRRSPALTALVERETFLDEALFLQQSKRVEELVRYFHVPIDQLLGIAVRHEMGHAICHDPREATANRIAGELREGEAPECNGDQKGVAPIDELYLRSPFSGLRLWR